MRKGLGIYLAIFLASPAHAVFIKTQMERIDHEPLFDENYFVSLNSFRYPYSWDDLWRASTAPAYRINAASLDCCDLFLQQQLRFDRKLGDGFLFKYRLEQQEDKERQEIHQWLEMEKNLLAGVSGSIFGEPTFHKEDADIGFGLNYTRGGFRAVARRYFVDFNFNRRGSTTQRYSRYPLTDEFSLQWRGQRDLLRGWLEIDHPTRRHVPVENRLFSYRRINLTVEWARRTDRWSPGAEYQYEFQVKENRFVPDPNALSVENRRQVHRGLLRVEGPLGPRDRLEAGQAVLVRAARSDFANSPDGGIFYDRWEVQPYARWRRQLKPRLVGEIANFMSFGDNRRRTGGAAGSSAQSLAKSKMGAGLDFLFSSGRIELYTTWKLDDPSHPWGGGNIRAMFLF